MASQHSNPGRGATEVNETFYDGFWAASDFARYNPGARHRRRIILDVLRGRLQGGSLLDVGCGDGRMLQWLGEHLPAVSSFSGADLSSATAEANARTYPGTTFHTLDISTAHLPQQFDAVVCSEVLEHVGDRAASMQNLAAMVKPGGWLLVTCPTGPQYETERHFGHVGPHPEHGELETLGTAAGLRLVESRNWGWPLYRAMKWATNVNAQWSLRHFGARAYSTPAKLLSHALYVLNKANVPNHRRGCQLFMLFTR
jgi:SAM-dependent methyltransferase